MAQPDPRKKILKQLIGPGIQAQNTIVSLQNKLTEVQYQIQGTNKRKAPATVIPDLVGEALLDFLQKSDEVTCDEIAKAFEAEKTSGSTDGVNSPTHPPRKTRRFSQRKGGSSSKTKDEISRSNDQEVQLSVNNLSATNTIKNISEEGQNMGGEAASIVPPMDN